MATLPTLRPSGFVSSTGTSTTTVTNVNDNSDATFIAGATNTGPQWVYELDNTPSDFLSMDSYNVVFRVRLSSSGDDTWSARVYLTDSGGIPFGAPGYTLVSSASFTTITFNTQTLPGTNTKTVWDGARIVIEGSRSQNMGGDGNALQVADAWVTGTYTQNATAPAAITDLSATPWPPGDVRLTFTAPSDGGSAISEYEYRFKQSSSGTWGSWTSTFSTSTTIYLSMSTLSIERGTSYDFQVRAVNALGAAADSNTATTVTPGAKRHTVDAGLWNSISPLAIEMDDPTTPVGAGGTTKAVVRARVSSGHSGYLHTDIYEGTTFKQRFTNALTTSFADYTNTITSTISNWDNVVLNISGVVNNSAGYIDVSWAEITLPETRQHQVEALLIDPTKTNTFTVDSLLVRRRVVSDREQGFSLSNLTYSSNNKNVSDIDTGVNGMYIRAGGTEIFFTGSQNNRTQIRSLPTAWDLTSLTTLVGAVANNLNSVSNTQGVCWSSNGQYIYRVAGDNITRHTASTAFRFDSLSSLQTLSPGDTAASGIFISPDGGYLFVSTKGSSNQLKRWTLSTAYSLSGASVTQTASTGSISGLWFNSAGTKVVVSLFSSELFRLYELSTPWDISTVSTSSYVSEFDPNTLGLSNISPEDVFVDPDYKYVFWVDGTSDVLYRLEVPEYTSKVDAVIIADISQTRTHNVDAILSASTSESHSVDASLFAASTVDVTHNVNAGIVNFLVPTVIQTGGQTSTTSETVTFSSATTGNLLVAVFRTSNTSHTTHGGDSGWIKIFGANDTASTIGVSMWYKQAAGGETSALFTHGGDTTVTSWIALTEFSGEFDFNNLIIDTTAASDPGSNISSVPISGPTVDGPALIVSTIGTNAAVDYSWNVGIETREQDRAAMAYSLAYGAGTHPSETVTLTSATRFVAITSAFRINISSNLTHTVDSIISSQIEKTHSVDSLLLTTQEVTGSVDSIVLQTIGMGHNADAYLKKIVSRSNAVDAAMRPQPDPAALELSGGGNMLLSSFELLHLAFTEHVYLSHAVDSILSEQTERTYAVDTVLLKEITIGYSTDSIFKAEDQKSHQLDAVLLLTDQKDHSADTVLLKVQTVAGQTDAIFLATSEVTSQVDGIILSTNNINHNVDTVLSNIDIRTHTVDSSIMRIVDVTHSADTVLRDTKQIESQVDALMSSKVRIYAETVLQNSNLGNASNALGAQDGVFTTNTGSQSFSARFALQDVGAPLVEGATHTIYVRIRKDATGGDNPTFTVWLYDNGSAVRQFVSGSVLGDGTSTASYTFNTSEVSSADNIEVLFGCTAANPILTINDRTIQIDWVGADVWTYVSRNYVTQSADAVLRDVATRSNTVDALLKTTTEASHSVDSRLYKTSDLVHSVDTILRAEKQVVSLGDAVLKALITQDHLVDALFLETTTLTHSVDVIALATLESTHSVDATVADRVNWTHEVDANIQLTSEMAHSVTAWVASRVEETHAADAVLSKTATRFTTVDALLTDTTQAVHSVDANILSIAERDHDVEAILLDARQRVSLADAVLLKVTELTQDTDAVLRSSEARAYATDALILAITEMDHLADAVILASQTPAHSVDSIVVSRPEGTHAVDATLQQTYEVAYSVDASTASRAVEDHSVDAVLLDISTKLHTVDSLLSLQTELVSNADAVLKATSEKTHTVEALLTGGFQSLHETDAILLSTDIREHNVDTVLRLTSEVAQSADALLLLTASESHVVDALLEITVEVTHTADAIILAAQESTHSVDARIISIVDGTHTVDAVLLSTETRVQTVDAYFSLRLVEVHNVDALLQTTEIVEQTADAVLLAEQVETHSVEALIAGGDQALHGADAILLLTSERTHTLDAVLQTTESTTHLVDAVLLEVAEQTHDVDFRLQLTSTEGHDVDVVLLATLEETHTVDARIIDIVDGSHTVDALLLKTRVITHASDAQVADRIEVVHIVDALLQVTEELTHSVDASVVIVGAQSAHSVDALLSATRLKIQGADTILRAVQEEEHAVDAHLFVAVGVSHSSDAILLKVGTEEVLVDAVIRATQSISSNTDSILRDSGSTTHLSDAVLKSTELRVVAVDARLVTSAVATGHSVDALLQTTREVSVSADAILSGESVSEHNVDAELVSRSAATHSVDAEFAPPTGLIGDVTLEILQSGPFISIETNSQIRTIFTQSPSLSVDTQEIDLEMDN